MVAQRVKQELKKRVLLLVAASLLGSAAAAHDFGGTSSGGGGDPPPPPTPPCNSCPCSGPSGGGDGGGGNGGGPGNTSGNPNASGGKPVSFYNGAEEMSVTDLIVNGIFPIVLQRKYDNRSTYDSPLGYGWAFLHDRRLYEYPDNSVVVRHGCGTRDRYVHSGGSYVTPTGSMLATLSEMGDGSFHLKYLNGVVDSFDSQGRLTSATDVRGNRHEYTYDSRGKLPLVGSSKESISTTQPMTVAYNYRLTRIDVRGADGALTGRYVTFDYNESTGRLVAVTADDGRSVAYAHDTTASLTLGNLTQVNGLGGVTAAYVYADPLDAHNLTSITPSQGRTSIVNTYDDQDRVTRQEEGTRRMDIAYNVPYTRTTVTKTIRDHNGLNPYTAATVYEFDTIGRVTKLIDALGHETRYIYNAAKMVTRKEIWQKDGATLFLLQSADWTYDANGNKLTETVAMGGGETITRSWTYDHNWISSEQVVSSAAPARVLRTEYTFYTGSDGRPTNVQSEKRRKDDGSFQTKTYNYDNRNRLLSTIYPDGVTRVNEYSGEHLSRTYYVVNGVSVSHMERRYEYDLAGNATKEWNSRNHMTQYAYDDRRRMIEMTNALGEKMVYSYAGDRLHQLELGRTNEHGEGQLSRVVYDMRNQIGGVQRKADAGNWTTIQTILRDGEGRPLQSSDGENHTVLLSYDAVGKVASRTDADGNTTTFTYDAAGNRRGMTDARGNQTLFEYDALNRITAVVQIGVSPNARTEYRYDTAGNLVSVKDAANHTTAYAYDSLSRRTRITQPDGQFVTFTYDARDRVATVVNARGQSFQYEYEPWGPVKAEREYLSTSATTPVRTVTYGRDTEGNVVTVTDDAVQTTPMVSLSYDELSRPIEELVRYIPGGVRTVTFSYDRFGNRDGISFLDGTQVSNTYTYNKLNRLVAAELAGASISVGYLNNGNRQIVSLPNGVSQQFMYRPMGSPESIRVNGPAGQLANFGYTYDDFGNVESETDDIGTHSFTYDGLNRLLTATRTNGTSLPNESYGYDLAGNRENPTNPNEYVYDNNNRVTAALGSTYSFDDDGNILGRSDGAAFVHDVRNRLVQYTKGSVNGTYLYDSSGRRIKKTAGGSTTWFLWDGGVLLAEFDGSGHRTKTYGYLGDDMTPLQFKDSTAVYYIHTDRLGAARLATNTDGQIVWRLRPQAFGLASVEDDVDGNLSPVTLNLRFPGQYYDPETATHYNFHRNYDPSIGRYMQADPLGLHGGMNVYAYAGNSPTTHIDPFGLYIPKETEDCKLKFFPPFDKPIGSRRDSFGVESFTVWIPVVVFWRREVEVPGWLKITQFWEQYILWKVMQHNQGYLYICTETLPCGQTQTKSQSGHHSYEYEVFDESGVRRWIEHEYVDPYNPDIPNKLPPPYPF